PWEVEDFLACGGVPDLHRKVLLLLPAHEFPRQTGAVPVEYHIPYRTDLRWKGEHFLAGGNVPELNHGLAWLGAGHRDRRGQALAVRAERHVCGPLDGKEFLARGGVPDPYPCGLFARLARFNEAARE